MSCASANLVGEEPLLRSALLPIAYTEQACEGHDLCTECTRPLLSSCLVATAADNAHSYLVGNVDSWSLPKLHISSA